MSPLVGNHDKGRFMAYADGDLPDAKIDKEEEVGWTKPPKVDDAENYKKLELAQAFLMSIDETFDIGSDTRTPVDDKDYRVPFRFTGKLAKVTFKLGAN